MDTTEFIWRTGLLVAAIAAAVYFVVIVLRLRGLGRNQEGSDAVPFTAGREPELVFVAAPVTEEAGPPPAFGEQLAWKQVTSELEGLRAEVATLRGELAALQEQVEEMKALRRVSPQYADAADLARRGFDARGVAAECGISVAEAELVLALSNGDKKFEDEVNDDRTGHDYRIESADR